MNDIIEAIKEFFVGDKASLPNYELSFQRFFTLFLTIGVTILLIYLFRKKSQKAKRMVLTILAISVLITEVVTKILRYTTGSQTNLVKLLIPMQFSSLVVLMIIVTIFYRKQWFLNITTVAVLFSGILYLIAPGAGMNTTPIRMDAFNSIYTHSVDFVFGFFAVYYNLAKLYYKDLWQIYLFYALCGIYGGLLNLVFYPGSSYFYLSAPDIRALIPLFPYEILLGLIIIVYVQLLYWIKNRKSRKQV